MQARFWDFGWKCIFRGTQFLFLLSFLINIFLSTKQIWEILFLHFSPWLCARHRWALDLDCIQTIVIFLYGLDPECKFSQILDYDQICTELIKKNCSIFCHKQLYFVNFLEFIWTWSSDCLKFWTMVWLGLSFKNSGSGLWNMTALFCLELMQRQRIWCMSLINDGQLCYVDVDVCKSSNSVSNNLWMWDNFFHITQSEHD